MNNDKNARLTVHGRALLITRILEDGLRPPRSCTSDGCQPAYRLQVARALQKRRHDGLHNRSSWPRYCLHETPPDQQQQIIEQRRERRVYRHIGAQLGVSVATVGRVIRRAGLNRLSALEPARPSNRYEHDNPGDLLHLDINKLARFRRPGHRVTGEFKGKSHGAGWEYIHMAIDDHSRVAWATTHDDETAASAWRALTSAIRYYRSLGIRIQRLLTDNGCCYRSALFARACRRLGLKHGRTQPYTPRTNGKAERWIQTALREWAYARSYDDSEQRADHLKSRSSKYMATSVQLTSPTLSYR